MVEFYAENSADASLYLSELIRQRPFKMGLCKSFDDVIVDAAKALGWAMVETGFLFRKRVPVILNKPDTFRLQRAQSTDLAEAWATGRDFYDGKDEIVQLHDAGGLWIASHGGKVIGSGVAIPLDGSGDVVDIGMVTRPDQRNKGFASFVIDELATLLEREDKRPICGCAETNLASKAALENAGFVSEHRLVQFTVPN